MTTKTITRGSEQDRMAFTYARREQGFGGAWEAWLEMPLNERQEFESGAACGDPAMKVVEMKTCGKNPPPGNSKRREKTTQYGMARIQDNPRE